MKNYLLILSCLCCWALGSAQLVTGTDVAVANTTTGQVRGYINNAIYTYKGIPYAKAQRFKAPEPADSWEGVRSSMTYGPVAPLITPTTSVNDESEFVFDHDWGYPNEDCLVLNIWTPSIDDGKKRPVMFWIHGGGYTAGSSQELPSYHGENLAKKGDVVVVSINHRLNILGFLDLSAYGDEYKTSANNSLLDMQAALQWVQDNISNFGGDPDNVMIFGQSGGGAKVNNLMAMPSAKGLFHKAVNQSGSFRTAVLEKETTQEITAELIKELDIADDPIGHLTEMPFEQLAEAGTKALKTVEERMQERGEEVPGFGLGWGPSVDGEVLPYQMFSDDAFALSKDIPLMIGTTKNEFMGSIFSGMSIETEETAKMVLQYQHGDKTDQIIDAIRNAYPADTHPSDLVDVDLIFRPGAVIQADKKSMLSDGAPVYMYLFTWQSPVLDGKYKAFHCMELPFVFDNIERCKRMTGGGREAHILADKMSQAWINFARYGDPNHAGLPTWEPYTAEGGTTLFFDNHIHIQHHHDKELMAIMNED